VLPKPDNLISYRHSAEQIEPIIRRLAQTAAGAAGIWVACGIGEGFTPESIRISNDAVAADEGIKALAGFGSSRAVIDGTEKGLNPYLAPALMRPDLSGGRGGADDVIATLALCTDHDGGDWSPDKVRACLPIEPHAMVETSPGSFQSWYFLDTPAAPADAAPIIRALANLAGGDMACKNLDRLYRMPGMMNLPNGKKRKNGRVPVMAKLLTPADTIAGASVALDEFRAAMVTKWGQAAFEEAQKSSDVAKTAAIDWSRPRVPQKAPYGNGEFVRLPFGEYKSGSEGCWHINQDGLRRGHSPDEMVGYWLANQDLDSPCIKHYTKDGADFETSMRRDLERAILDFDNPANSEFPDKDRNGRPRATPANTLLGLRKLQLNCRYDVFHARFLIEKHALSEHVNGELADNACLMLCKHFCEQFQFQPSTPMMHDAVKTLGLTHCFDPLCDYLDSLKWDRKPRLDTWLVEYLGAEDTPFNRAVSCLSLTAAVRRARVPGYKFDQITVLESPQG
jgi:hypothetical protein